MTEEDIVTAGSMGTDSHEESVGEARGTASSEMDVSKLKHQSQECNAALVSTNLLKDDDLKKDSSPTGNGFTKLAGQLLREIQAGCQHSKDHFQFYSWSEMKVEMNIE